MTEEIVLFISFSYAYYNGNNGDGTSKCPENELAIRLFASPVFYSLPVIRFNLIPSGRSPFILNLLEAIRHNQLVKSKSIQGTLVSGTFKKESIMVLTHIKSPFILTA